MISRGGFSPADVALLDDVFLTAWRQIECRYPLEDADRNVAREQLASIVVMLGQSWEMNRTHCRKWRSRYSTSGRELTRVFSLVFPTRNLRSRGRLLFAKLFQTLCQPRWYSDQIFFKYFLEARTSQSLKLNNPINVFRHGSYSGFHTPLVQAHCLKATAR